MNAIDPLSDDIGFLLTRAGAIMSSSANKALAEFGLKVRPYSVLVIACEQRNGLGQRQIAEELGLDPSQIVGLVDDLETRELLSRQVNPEDRRNKRIAATSRGRSLCQEMQRAVTAAQAEALVGVSVRDAHRLRQLLQNVVLG